MISNVGPWNCIGDFNVITGVNEYRGSTLPSRLPSEEFCSFFEEANLIHLPTRGAEFTWSNRRSGLALTEKRLDRSLCNEDWLSFWQQVSCCTLPRVSSYHYPLLLCSTNSNFNGISSFRFLKMWLHHPGISEVVRDSWSQPLCGYPMFIFSTKLKRLKMVLKHWNVNVFGNIHQRVKEAWSNVDTIQNCINDHGLVQDMLNQENLAQINLLKALAIEEDYWKEKSRLNWQISGDRNTSFFHKVTKIRQVTKSML
ncbi:unnamed protein product [Lupinus luteus]|uniref:Uncharacterized protein n=1 Tax=Lupinus luteus TaxID=3873 RepID=A0AAV1XSM8_LUPLU